MINETKHTVPLLVHDVAHQMRLAIDNKVAPFNLTRQKWVALSILEENPGISQIELAERLAIDRSTAGRLLDRMEKRGLIFRVKDVNDRRITRVYIDEEAKPVLHELHEVSTEIKAVSEEGLSEDEQTELVRLLRKLSKNLKVSLGSFACMFDFSEQVYFLSNIL